MIHRGGPGPEGLVPSPLRWRLLDTPPARGAWNMAVDAALMDSVRAGGEPVLRLYRWSPACLSLGRNQPAVGLYDAERLRGVDVVRRPTGGRAVLHDHELTYAAIMPEGALGSPRTCYATINGALVAGLRRLGVPAELQPRTNRRAPPPSLAPCFRDPAEGEVVVRGRKLIGSAQLREAGVVLQHGSLLLSGDQRAVAGLLRNAPPGVEEGRPATLDQLCSPAPGWEALTAALAAGWVEVVGGELCESALSEAEVRAARELAARYAAPGWTWRR